MRVFNSSHVQRYAHHELDIKPGFTDVPPEREESVKALIKRYPHHLSEGGTAPAELRAKADTIAAQAVKIASLEAQNKKLQQLLTEDPKSGDPKAVANRRAKEAEEALAEAREQIATLQARVSELEEAAKA